MKKSYNPKDEKWVRQAIELARENVSNGGGPFGAVIVKAQQLIAQGVNRVTAQHDPTAHAEVIAIRMACEKLQSHQLSDCTLYSSCEPCPMCLGAVYWAGMNRVVFASTRFDAEAAGFGDAAFYADMEKDIHERSVPMKQMRLTQAGAEFEAWLNLNDRILY